ncbi:CPBP family intramembrane glutamic endopeptidase [Halogeometricum luteum]|uniref:CPBP family intramembrane metalloprotease n=1 Tax=Halogeometricum luteum TaxID=2950537 RepID=A0ABU2FYA2_9EURY|nr:CPBP family intramembrane glutamic endopeptidase [Halogeometricum sp. S3BR5-2]MDS0293497.1 CPBP family intramembrane metalloprotease [Halogeometricum sp. S3BR5-2]
MNYDSLTSFDRRSRARVRTLDGTRLGGVAVTAGRVLLALAAILLAVAAFGAASVAAIRLLGADVATSVPVAFVAGLVGTLGVLGAYAAYVRVVEARPVTELGRRGAVREFLSGTVLGAGLFTAAVGVVWVAGGYEVTGTNPWLLAVPFVTGALFWAALEELVYRAVLLRIVERRFGTWVALVGSSLAFAAFHVVATPNVTVWTGLTVFLAGLWLGGAYLYTRRLWLPVALHAAWNFAQGAVFGIAVSGDEGGQGLLVGVTSGPTWLTGGAYGLEGSAVVVVVVLLAAAVVLRAARRDGRFVPSRRS